MTIFNVKHKEETVAVFMRNLLSGDISIDFEKFQREEKVEKFAAMFHKKLRRFQEYDMCPNDDGSPPDTTDWLYEVIFEGRFYGAIKGDFKQKNYEERIEELEQQIENLKNENKKLEDDNTALAGELFDARNLISTYEKPIVSPREEK